MMPTPPMACSNARHSSSPAGMWSRPTITVAPVVVRPDMVSNSASAGLSLEWPNISGNDAKTLTTIQVSTVSRKVCRRVNSARECPRLPSHSSAPAKAVITEAPTKPRFSRWP